MEGLELFWTGFSYLSRSRGLVQGIRQAIQISEILFYAEAHGVEDLDEFLFIVVELDEHYLKLMAEKDKERLKSGGNSSGKN